MVLLHTGMSILRMPDRTTIIASLRDYVDQLREEGLDGLPGMNREAQLRPSLQSLPAVGSAQVAEGPERIPGEDQKLIYATSISQSSTASSDTPRRPSASSKAGPSPLPGVKIEESPGQPPPNLPLVRGNESESPLSIGAAAASRNFMPEGLGRGPMETSVSHLASPATQQERDRQERARGRVASEALYRYPALEETANLDALREFIGACTRCKLAPGRTNLVFGVGNPNAQLMFVGEAPGEDEDLRGEPFVGRAGQLLTDIIEHGMGMPRDEVYICNVIKCRPPGNRNPEPDEVAACEPFLFRQIDVVRPQAIVGLGTFAVQALLKVKTPISKLRGIWHEVRGVKLMPTFHPAYLLRNPADKRLVWADIQQVMKHLGRPIPPRGARR